MFEALIVLFHTIYRQLVSQHFWIWSGRGSTKNYKHFKAQIMHQNPTLAEETQIKDAFSHIVDGFLRTELVSF